MEVKIVKTSENGIDYLKSSLQIKKSVTSNAVFWKIPKADGAFSYGLKIGRYKRATSLFILPELAVPRPKSELTLNDSEFHSLISFLQQCYEPFSQGIRAFIPVEHKLGDEVLGYLKSIISSHEHEKILSFLAHNEVFPDEILVGLELAKRKRAVIEFEKLLNEGEYFAEYKVKKAIGQDEGVWQNWFTYNSWVLGTDFISILDERRIDAENITDFLMKTYDGFIDLIEIKKSNGFNFWARERDHNNCVPSSDLIKAITQSSKYVYELEREANSVKFQERVGYVKTVKPRITLIFGRSNAWDSHEREAYRILNASYHNISIMTYDHVLERAKRIVGE